MGMSGRILLRAGRGVGSWWRRAFPKTPEHVHSDLRNFEQRLTAYREASDAARAEARAVLRNRSAAAGSAIPGTVLGAGLTAVVALTGLIGTYTIFLMQSGVAGARDAQARSDALHDAGKLEEATTSLSAAMKSLDGLLSSGGELLVGIGAVVVGSIFLAWVIARDRAALHAVATAWLEAYLEVEDTAPVGGATVPRVWWKR
ncbi:hypothetical protein [Curtobacterium sp. 9128]|uniref:hypothetical protein n=1 Tax=Curtobacterium sp. 9128 TaxID=1793722 RepID=UPI0011A25266|nr:hypothetical protein [Curtobacterium sp. 9128]